MDATALDLVVSQTNPALSLFLCLVEAGKVARLEEIAAERARGASRGAHLPAPRLSLFLRHASVYTDTVGPSIQFPQGQDSTACQVMVTSCVRDLK